MKKEKAVAVNTEEDKWRIEEDARTLKRAYEVTKDKTRLKRAKDFISKEIKDNKAIEDIFLAGLNS